MSEFHELDREPDPIKRHPELRDEFDRALRWMILALVIKLWLLILAMYVIQRVLGQ